MAYPPNYVRAKNFGDDQANGLPLNMTDLDTEYNRLLTSLNAEIARLNTLTNADGTLKNLSSAQAQALSGAQRYVASAAQTIFATAVTWAASFSNLNVEVFRNGVKLDPSTVSVANAAGLLSVTIPASTGGDIVVINAFESGAGLTAALVSVVTGKGASLIGIEDAGAHTAQVTVEAALQEIYAAISPSAMATALALVATYLAKAGGSMTGDITFDGTHTVKSLPASAANGQAVRHEQLAAVISQLNAASSTFLAKSGGTLSGDIDCASTAKVKNLPTATANGDAVPLTQVNSLITANNALPSGSVVAYGTGAAPSGWLLCDGSAVSRATYAALFAVIGVNFGVGDGSTTFNLPDLMGRVVVGKGAGSGLTVRSLNDKGGEETHLTTIAEMPSHGHTSTLKTGTGIGGGGGFTFNGTSEGLTGGGLAHNNMQPYTVLAYIIKQ